MITQNGKAQLTFTSVSFILFKTQSNRWYIQKLANSKSENERYLYNNRSISKNRSLFNHNRIPNNTILSQTMTSSIKALMFLYWQENFLKLPPRIKIRRWGIFESLKLCGSNYARFAAVLGSSIKESTSGVQVGYFGQVRWNFKWFKFLYFI